MKLTSVVLATLCLESIIFTQTYAAVEWRCTTSPTATQKQAAIDAYNSLSIRRLRYTVDENYWESECNIPQWLLKPEAIDFKVKKVCWKKTWTSPDGSRTVSYGNYTVLFSDSCGRRVRAKLHMRYKDCTPQYDPYVTGLRDHFVLPVVRAEKIKLLRNRTETFPNDECPPEAPWPIRRHNPHQTPVFDNFYGTIMPVFYKLWYNNPKQMPKPFYYQAANAGINSNYPGTDGGFFSGCVGSFKKNGHTYKRLLVYTSIETTRWKPSQIGEPPYWDGHFFFNLTSILGKTFDSIPCATTLEDWDLKLVANVTSG